LWDQPVATVINFLYTRLSAIYSLVN